jgi:DNA-binding transcriptional MerR regulator/methylmalonyl-CoA mutase cobalamin-binding subunit
MKHLGTLMKDVDYPIRAVAKLTGLSIDTLRAWERRYEVVKPQRDDRGRLYTQSDVQRLQLLRAAVEKGHAIGRLATLSDQQLRELLSRSATAATVSEIATAARASPKRTDLQSVLGAIGRFDYAGAEQELNRLALLSSPRELIQEVVTPLMQRIGEDWRQGRLSIAQEHMVSALLRNLLGALVRLYARNDPAARLLFATPSGELHEFGVLSAAMLASGGGLGIVYLGPNLPADEIVEAAKRTSVQVVALGVAETEGKKGSLKSLRQVADELPPRTELWIGGPKAESLAREIKGSRIVFLADFNSLEQHLTRLGARF